MIIEDDSDDELVKGRAYLVLIRRLIVRIQSLADELVEPHGLTGAQFLTMLIIGNNNGLTQAALVRLIESDANSVSAMVRRLAERGLLIRRPHPDDKRAMQLKLSDEGTRIAKAGLVEMNRLSRHLARTMPKGQSDAITSWLSGLVELRAVA